MTLYLLKIHDYIKVYPQLEQRASRPAPSFEFVLTIVPTKTRKFFEMTPNRLPCFSFFRIASNQKTEYIRHTRHNTAVRTQTKKKKNSCFRICSGEINSHRTFHSQQLCRNKQLLRKKKKQQLLRKIRSLRKTAIGSQDTNDSQDTTALQHICNCIETRECLCKRQPLHTVLLIILIWYNCFPTYIQLAAYNHNRLAANSWFGT